MIVNIWIALSDAAQSIVITALRWDEESQGAYTGPLTRRQVRLFEYMQDDAARRKLFSSATLAGTTYNLWSIDFDDSKETLQVIRDELDGLIAQYPNQIAVVGAWKHDGAMAGCQLVLTEVPNPDYVGEPFEIPNPAYQPDPEQPNYDPRENLRNPLWVPEFLIERSQTGTPLYPLPNWLWRFMPPWRDENGDLTSAQPSSNADLTDVNLLFGQGQRIFS